MALEDIKTQLEQSNATISEIAEDVAELMTTNATLVQKISELESGQPNNQLIQEIASLAASQAASLRSIADVVPEAPVEPPTEG